MKKKNLRIVVTCLIHTISYKGNHQNDFLFSSEMTGPLLNKFQENSLIAYTPLYRRRLHVGRWPVPAALGPATEGPRDPQSHVHPAETQPTCGQDPKLWGRQRPILRPTTHLRLSTKMAPASLNDAEWHGQVWMTYCGDTSNVKVKFVKLEAKISIVSLTLLWVSGRVGMASDSIPPKLSDESGIRGLVCAHMDFNSQTQKILTFMSTLCL